MKLIVIDSLGIRSGIRIDGLKLITDRVNDQIRITGIMSAQEKLKISDSYEPDITVVFFDKYNNVICSATSTHEGDFWLTRYLPLKIEISNVNQKYGWSEMSYAVGFVIYHERDL